MKANCWIGKHNVQVQEVPDPQILNERDAIVKITSTAICGSDLHLYNGFVPSMESGDVLGHEFTNVFVQERETLVIENFRSEKFFAEVKAIDADDLVTLLKKVRHHHRSDVSTGTGHENCLHVAEIPRLENYLIETKLKPLGIGLGSPQHQRHRNLKHARDRQIHRRLETDILSQARRDRIEDRRRMQAGVALQNGAEGSAFLARSLAHGLDASHASRFAV